MKTLRVQTSLFTEEELTSLQVDSHANHTHPQESDLEKKMTDTSGLKCLEQFEKFNRCTSWAKMFAASLIGMEGWYSTKCRLIWKIKATKCSRFYFQLVPSTLHTDEIGFGLLATPNTGGRGERELNENGENINSKGVRFGASLLQVSRAGMLLTPTAMDSTNATATMKSTQVKEGSMHSVTLTRAMAMGMLPTPVVSDMNAGRRGNAPRDGHNPMTNSLKDAVNFIEETSKCSHLSPQFVMEMMGFPTDWTLLPFLSGETNPSKQEGTQ